VRVGADIVSDATIGADREGGFVGPWQETSAVAEWYLASASEVMCHLMGGLGAGSTAQR
jgi:hypothetical protein